jgi:membrane fusion protein, multidrug efflux system
MKRIPKRKIIMIVTLLLILAMGAWQWTKKAGKGGFMPPKSVVIVTQVSSQDMPTLVRALGTLTAINSAEIAAEIGGTIESIPFTNGAQVKKGDVLIKLEDNTEEAKLLQAQAQKQLSEVDYNRLKNLQSRGAVSKQEFDKSEADLKVAEAEVTLAQAELDKTTLRAPFDGQVGSSTYSVGQYITAGQPLVSLVDKTKLQIRYSVPQRYLEHLKLNSAVTFETPAYPNEKFVGAVNYLSPSVDVATRTLAVEAVFDNPQGKLLPGLSGTVLQVLTITPNALIVPEEALVPSITGYQVFRVVEGKALATPIEIGTRKDGAVQILSGLQAGDTLVLQGHQNLRDGALVDIQKAGE